MKELTKEVLERIGRGDSKLVDEYKGVLVIDDVVYAANALAIAGTYKGNGVDGVPVVHAVAYGEQGVAFVRGSGVAVGFFGATAISDGIDTKKDKGEVITVGSGRAISLLSGDPMSLSPVANGGNLYFDYAFNYKQLTAISHGFMGGLPVETVLSYASLENPSRKMALLRDAYLLSKHGRDPEVDAIIKVINEDKYDLASQLILGAERGLSSEQLTFMRGPKLTEHQILQTRFAFENGLSLGDAKAMTDESLDFKGMVDLRESLERDAKAESALDIEPS